MTYYIDHITLQGIIRIRELPRDCTEDDFRAWWPHLTERERDHYTVQRFHNLLTTSGKNALIAYMQMLSSGGANVSVAPWAQKFALGTGVVTGIGAGDTSLFGQVVNKAITAVSSVSQQLDYSTYFGVSDFSNSTVTNGGLFSGSGAAVLYTHFAAQYTKGNLPFTFDYLINME